MQNASVSKKARTIGKYLHASKDTQRFPGIQKHIIRGIKGKHERVTARKARGLQREEALEAANVRHFFLSLLRGRRKQSTSVRFFSFFIQN